MYTGEVDPLMKAEGVLALAERYQLKELKQLCEQKLCITTNKYNLVEMICMADLYNLPALEEVTIALVLIFRHLPRFLFLSKCSSDRGTVPS